jgi:hypothetical protein
MVHFRNGDALAIPPDHIFEAITETLLLNVYRFDQLKRGRVVVDIGASIGDFAVLATQTRGVHLYAYEPTLGTFTYLQSNVKLNRREHVWLFNHAADARTLGSILSEHQETCIDFLKVDCEGCEYSLLLGCPEEILARVKRIAMEIHEVPNHSTDEIFTKLKIAGFRIQQVQTLGHGHYVHAARSQPSPST